MLRALMADHAKAYDFRARGPFEGQYGAFLLESPEAGWRLALICDDGTHAEVPESLGWEHVSVHAFRSDGKQRTPTWKEMSYVKRLCWDADDCVVQYHPPESDYVNLHPHTLHLWCSRTQAMPRPPGAPGRASRQLTESPVMRP
jgi:hypothetical protein